MNNDFAAAEAPAETPLPEDMPVASQASAPGATNSERMQRAEASVDQAGETLGRAVSNAGHAVLRLVARAREEAEDLWAEAQHLRTSGFSNGNASPATDPAGTGQAGATGEAMPPSTGNPTEGALSPDQRGDEGASPSNA